MTEPLHITSGDCAGDMLRESGVPGEVFVWHDVLYDGPRDPGWPDAQALAARARFLEEMTAGGMTRERILHTLEDQYRKLGELPRDRRVVLWFDACLFDQSMLAHVLVCLGERGARAVDLLCVDAFPGIEPFIGLGQLTPAQLAALAGRAQPVTGEQFYFAGDVDQAFATQDTELFEALEGMEGAPLPWVPAAVTRWLQERPDPATGLGRLERLALEAIQRGREKPREIFEAVVAAETPPQYWGDITLWAKINGLAERSPPLVEIAGPEERLPQWLGGEKLKRFRVRPA